MFARFWKHRREFGEGAARTLAHAQVGLDAVGPLERLAALAFGQRDHAPRRAPPRPDSGRPVDLVNQHEFGRAAADVEDQGRPVARFEQLVTAENRQACFLLRLDDIQNDSGLIANAVDELAAVGGAAAGFSRDRPR